MEKETMLVTQGLNELKLLASRITNKIQDTSFIVGAKTSNPNIMPGITKDTYKASAVSAYQSIKDLIERRSKIKAAIVESNAKTLVIVGGREMTVAAAIDLKSTIEFEKDLLTELQNQQKKAQATVNSKNLDVDKAIDNYLTTMFGSEAKKDKQNYMDVITPIREANEYSLVDPIGCQTVIDDLAKWIGDFEAEVDSVLQISNCTTTIEF